MRNPLFWIAVLLAPFGTALDAQDIVGDWQGTVKNETTERRIVMRIEKEADGGTRSIWFRIDQGTDNIQAGAVTSEGLSLKMAFDLTGGIYDAKVKADGSSIDGMLVPAQGRPLPLEFKRSSKETA